MSSGNFRTLFLRNRTRHSLVVPGFVQSLATSATKRRGAILVCVLVCMSICTALAVAGVKSSITARRQLRVQRQLRQVELLLEAGARRAFRQLAESPDYHGETWSLDAESLTGSESAQIVIEIVRSDSDQPQSVHIITTYPAQAPRPIRRRATLEILPPTAIKNSEE